MSIEKLSREVFVLLAETAVADGATHEDEVRGSSRPQSPLGPSL